MVPSTRTTSVFRKQKYNRKRSLFINQSSPDNALGKKRRQSRSSSSRKAVDQLKKRKKQTRQNDHEEQEKKNRENYQRAGETAGLAPAFPIYEPPLRNSIHSVFQEHATIGTISNK